MIGFAVTDLDKPPGDAAALAIKKLGPATRRATGKAMEALVWDAGQSARILLVLKTDASLLGTGTMMLIGRKGDLGMLGYNADDPGAIVKMMDAADAKTGEPPR